MTRRWPCGCGTHAAWRNMLSEYIGCLVNFRARPFARAKPSQGTKHWITRGNKAQSHAAFAGTVTRTPRRYNQVAREVFRSHTSAGAFFDDLEQWLDEKQALHNNGSLSWGEHGSGLKHRSKESATFCKLMESIGGGTV